MSMTSAGRVDLMPTFRHEALLYGGTADFVARTSPFIRDAVEAGQPILVVIPARKIDLLRDRLGTLSGSVRFVDMLDVGANPARIIPAWQDFVDELGGRDRPLRGIGEPVFPERSVDELIECEHHEALLNLAFENANLWLLCPYDTAALGTAVTGGAWHTHPVVRDGDAEIPSTAYDDEHGRASMLDAPLPPAPAHDSLRFAAASVREVRAFVAATATRAGLAPADVHDFCLAVSEAATNSVRHGGGNGVLHIWRTADGVVCEICDRGWINEPLAGRVRPTTEQSSGRGLWIVNQLCDLVQLRSSPSGTTIRMHMRLPR